MEKVCYETQFADYECTWNLTNAVFNLATVEDDFVIASTCLQAMILGDNALRPTEQFNDLYCNCYEALTNSGILGSEELEYFDNCADEIGWLVPTPSTHCQAWLE